MTRQIPMGTLARSFLLLLVCIPFLAPITRAQTPRGQFASRGEPPDNATARELRVSFEEVDGYVSRKRDEANRQKTLFDEKLAVVARQEQKQLAAKYVAELEGRGPFTENDLYYFGRLQCLAGKEEGALESLRLFLALTPQGETAQLARSVAIQCAIRKKFVDEAEQIAAEYESNAPNDASQRFEIESQLTSAFRNAADFERMATHAKVMYRLVKQKIANQSCKMPECEEMLVNATALVAEAYSKQNRPEDAAGVMQRLRALAISKPSVCLFNLAAQRSAAIDRSIDPFQTLADVTETGTVPELKAIDWVDLAPSKLSDLRGRVVLLDFWATWCGPCRQALPELRKWDASYKDKGLTIIGVTRYFGNIEGRKAGHEDELAYLRDFKKKNELSYAFAVGDSDADILNYGVYGIPSYVLIDRRGHVRSLGMGGGKGLEQMIKALIDEPVEKSESAAPEKEDDTKKPVSFQ